MMSKIFFCFLCLLSLSSFTQPYNYTTLNAHSHNDYEQKFPFWDAYNHGFGSIEADIFLVKDNDELLVAHSDEELTIRKIRLDSSYLIPISNCIRKNKGYPYSDTTKKLQILIDVKTTAAATLDKLVKTIKRYPELTNNPSVQFTISGNRPGSDSFALYPSFIMFDGELNKSYSEEALKKIVLMSASLRDYTLWNGKGRISENDMKKIESEVNRSHELKKPIRFWEAPDNINAWYALMHLHVDYINTDRISFLAEFLNKLPQNSYTAQYLNTTYKPLYKADKPVKNIILLLADGTGLAQLYAAYTVNKGSLNLFKIKNTGLLKTGSFNNYITDSATGFSAFSRGKKTNNSFAGTDHTGTALPLIPQIISKRSMKTGFITCGDITDAASVFFYADPSNRDSSAAIFHDLAASPAQLVMGSGSKSMNDTITSELKQSGYNIVSSVSSINQTQDKKWLLIDSIAGLSMLNGRGTWLQDAFAKAAGILSKNKAGFFLMLEDGQVDHGGHNNSLPYVVTEVLDFDQTVGKALEFADKNGETLVIVTASHETGGLTILDGDYTKGYVSGQFSTTDHTAVPVPVFAYGPQSQIFRGVYENTQLFNNIMTVLNFKHK